VYGQFRGRQLEDQPATASVDMRVSKHVSEERTIRVRVTAEHDDVAANDHVPTLRGGLTQPEFTLGCHTAAPAGVFMP
jgi:hypothetical protein